MRSDGHCKVCTEKEYSSRCIPWASCLLCRYPCRCTAGLPCSGNEMPYKQGCYANRHISKTNSKILNTAMTFSFLMAQPGNNFRSHCTASECRCTTECRGPGGHGPAPSSLPSVGTNRDMIQSSTSVFS